MTTSNVNTAEESKKRQVTGILMALEGFIQEASNAISDSLALNDIGEETDLIKHIKNQLNNPIVSIAKSNDILSNAIGRLKIDLIRSVATNRKDLIDFISYAFEDAVTHFFIGLKQDTEVNRDYFYGLIEKYEEHTISETHPMVLHFVTSDMLEGIFNLHNIPLDEQTPQSARS